MKVHKLPRVFYFILQYIVKLIILITYFRLFHKPCHLDGFPSRLQKRLPEIGLVTEKNMITYTTFKNKRSIRGRPNYFN